MVKRRRYDSARRTEQAAATRDAILNAAFTLFAANGYAATSIKEIAAAAGVAVPTVYAAFKDKPRILMGISAKVLGSESPEEGVLPAAYLGRIKAETDPVKRLQIVKTEALETYRSGVYDLEAIVLEAARVDTRVAEFTGDVLDTRLQWRLAVVKAIFDGVNLGPGVTLERIAEFVDAIDSAAVYRSLTESRNWTPEMYADWLFGMIERTFLPPG